MTANNLNKEDASANVVILEEFTHAAADLKDEAAGTVRASSKEAGLLRPEEMESIDL